MDRRPGSRKRLIAPLLVVLVLIASHHDAAPSTTASAAARAALDQGKTAEAAAMADSALAARKTRDAEYWALRVVRAEIAMRQGDGKPAEQIVAEELPRQYATSEAAVYRLILRSRVLRSAEPLAPARELAAKHQPHLVPVVMIPLIFNGLADQDLDVVDRNIAAEARRLGNSSAEARLKAARAYRLMTLNRLAEAAAAYENALPIAQKSRLAPTVANIHGNLGSLYRDLGDIENAAEHSLRAEAITRELGLVEEQTTWLLQAGNIAYDKRDYATAAKHYATVLPLAKSLSTKRHVAAAAAQNLAIIALESGRIAEARRYHEEGLALKRVLKDPDSLARADIFSAQLQMHDRNFDDAKNILDRVARESKAKAVQWEARGNLAQLYLKMSRPDLAEPQFREAIETLGEARAEIKGADLRLHFSRAKEVIDPYLDFLISQGRAPEALVVTDTYRAQTLAEELGVTRPRTFDPRAIAKNASATILTYWLGEERSYLWVITPERIALQTLPGDTAINAAVHAYQREIHGRRDSLRNAQRGSALYAMLVEKAGAFARDSRVVIVPDGQLHSLNFETLVVPSPKPHYWLSDVIVSTAGSLQLLATAPKRPASSPRMLLVGDPPQADRAFPALPHAAREINAVAQQFSKPVVLRGAQATPTAYAAAKPETFDYLHFVAHGVAMRQKPLESAVILGRENPSAAYRLSAREIVDRPLRAKLVTISSCYGAGSRTYGGEGLVGLAWAFLSAGADQVIAALWEVNDAATADLMKDMYAGIRQGRDPAAALRDAKLRLLRSNTIHAKPAYWAPFVVYAGR